MLSAAEILIIDPQRSVFFDSLEAALTAESTNWVAAAISTLDAVLDAAIRQNACAAVGAAIVMSNVIQELSERPRIVRRILATRSDVLSVADLVWTRAAQVNWPTVAPRGFELPELIDRDSARSTLRAIAHGLDALSAMEAARDDILGALDVKGPNSLDRMFMSLGSMMGMRMRRAPNLNAALAWREVERGAWLAQSSQHAPRDSRSDGGRNRAPDTARAWTEALAPTWKAVTGRKAGRSLNDYSGKVTGPFLRFVEKTAQAAGDKVSQAQVANALRNIRKVRR